MLQKDDAAAMDDAIEEVRSLTHAISVAVGHAEDLIDRRLAAIRRMHDLADRNVVVADRAATIEALASRRTPPLLIDMVLLAVLETGDHGASTAQIRSALVQRYGRSMDAEVVEGALRELVRHGRVLDRGTQYFAPKANLSRLVDSGGAPTIKAMVVEALEHGPSGGLPPPAIRKAIADVHQRQIPMTSIYPIIRQLEHAGRVAKTGRNWHLIDRSEARKS